jgi:hypothetical protein
MSSLTPEAVILIDTYQHGLNPALQLSFLLICRKASSQPKRYLLEETTAIYPDKLLLLRNFTSSLSKHFSITPP